MTGEAARPGHPAALRPPPVRGAGRWRGIAPQDRVDRASRTAHDPRVGVVVIGRNEGERLWTCLLSVARQADRIVYVDSGSRDDSVAYARALGIETVELDRDAPFTAARARNAGFARLTQRWPDIAFVQFIDGDCELRAGWIGGALAAMAENPQAAVLFGRRRERHPHATPYNRLCDMEWDGPPGPAESCGGDSLMRVEAFRQAGGFLPSLIAGEEPDLCHRLRRGGWAVLRLPCEMTLHDAAMTSLGQWWRRNLRSGHASAEAWARRGGEDRRLLKPVLSDLLWALPVAWPAWPLLWWRVWRRRGALYATHIVAGKLPHCAGHWTYWWNKARSNRHQLIEYK